MENTKQKERRKVKETREEGTPWEMGIESLRLFLVGFWLQADYIQVSNEKTTRRVWWIQWKKYMEMRGIEPRASRMQSERSTV